MKKLKKDPYEKQRKELASKLLADNNFKFESSVGICQFCSVELENDPIVSHKYIAYTYTDSKRYRIHGWGNTRIDAVIASLKHMESMGTTILRYMTGWSWAAEVRQREVCLKRLKTISEDPKKRKKTKPKEKKVLVKETEIKKPKKKTKLKLM